MFRLCASSVARVASRQLTSPACAPVAALTRLQPLSTVAECATANDALKYSGYSEIDFTIKEDATVYDAVQKFAAFNIGCLVTTDAAGKIA
jgi:predicted transcriptional regulator